MEARSRKVLAGFREAMPAFFDLLRQEPHPAVRVVLGHFIFVYIHPYVDGNGRVGRFLMNTMMASGGFCAQDLLREQLPYHCHVCRTFLLTHSLRVNIQRGADIRVPEQFALHF